MILHLQLTRRDGLYSSSIDVLTNNAQSFNSDNPTTAFRYFRMGLPHNESPPVPITTHAVTRSQARSNHAVNTMPPILESTTFCPPLDPHTNNTFNEGTS